MVQLTAEGELFYAEAMRSLAQVEWAINTAKRAAKGEVGKLSIGFLGSATYAFLPALVCTFKRQYPGVKLMLKELTPLQQEVAFAKGEIDIGFTRTLIAEKSRTFSSRCLYRDPLMAVLPRSTQVKTKYTRTSALSKADFFLFHRKVAPALFDMITRICNEAGFSPR